MLFFLRSITRPLAREEERLAHIAELACGRSEAEKKAQEIEKNGTSGVHGGGYFAPHDTNNNFWVLFRSGFYLRPQYSSTYDLRKAHHLGHHLPGGRFASRGALVELFLFIPRPHSF
jgi:hypothetical protein